MSLSRCCGVTNGRPAELEWNFVTHHSHQWVAVVRPQDSQVLKVNEQIVAADSIRFLSILPQ